MANDAKPPQATPGPWRAVGLNVFQEFDGDKPTRFICRTESVTESASAGEANARLIAAAPQMREALELAATELEEAARELAQRGAILSAGNAEVRANECRAVLRITSGE